jgi:hypothetical protein
MLSLPDLDTLWLTLHQNADFQSAAGLRSAVTRVLNPYCLN